MALEQRRNGRLYFYRKERRGGRVVSVYVGGGRLAELAARLAEIDQESTTQRRRQARAEREQLDALHRREAEREREFRRTIAAALTAAGYHNHKGQWRMQRHADQETDE